MVQIRLRGTNDVELLGTAEALGFLGSLIRNLAQSGSGAARCPAEVLCDPKSDPEIGLVRIKAGPQPLSITVLGKDLLIKGDQQALFALSAIMEFPDTCQSGERHHLEQYKNDCQVSPDSASLVITLK